MANLRFDLARPGLADNQLLVDEDRVASIRQPRNDLRRKRLVRLDVALVAEEHARSAEFHTVLAFHEDP